MMDTCLRKQNEGVRGSAEKVTMNPYNGDTKDLKWRYLMTISVSRSWVTLYQICAGFIDGEVNARS